MIKKTLFIAFALLGLSSLSLSAQSVINLNDQGDGTYTIDATVNGVGVKTYYTAENWFASMSSTTYLFLYENGYIDDADVKGVTVLKMPDGSTVKAASFSLKNLRIGKIIVQDLPTFVIPKQKVPFIVGNSAFDCFGELTQEGNRLIIDDGTVAYVPDDTPDEIDAKKAQIQELLDAKQYAEAAEGMKDLYEKGELSLYNEYQYATVLNILGKNDECIALSNNWLSQNAGRSLILDYWMYDALGDCYARKKDPKKSIEYYETAVETYCKLFNTSLKDIKKSKFKDETLSYTLYDLARQYASINIGKTEYYMALSAKSGNEAAVLFCKEVGLRY